MKIVNRIAASAAVLLCSMALSPAVMAQATRTWVSGVGDDANPCSRTAPCKTFAGAISKTAAEGIINVLDPGGFGAVTITKSITIDGNGTHAGVLASFGTNGVNVNAPGIKVILRNLSIEGSADGAIGVNFVNGATLAIENCKIFGFRVGSAMGVRMAAPGQLMIKDTNISDNAIGVHMETSSSNAIIATLDNVRVEDTGSYGVGTANTGPVFVMVKRSTIGNNTGHGIHAAGGASVITVVDSSISFNANIGVSAGASGALIRISGNAIVNNGNALGIAAGATIASDGTNRFGGAFFNPPNGTFTNQ